MSQGIIRGHRSPGWLGNWGGGRISCHCRRTTALPVHAAPSHPPSGRGPGAPAISLGSAFPARQCREVPHRLPHPPRHRGLTSGAFPLCPGAKWGSSAAWCRQDQPYSPVNLPAASPGVLFTSQYSPAPNWAPGDQARCLLELYKPRIAHAGAAAGSVPAGPAARSVLHSTSPGSGDATPAPEPSAWPPRPLAARGFVPGSGHLSLSQGGSDPNPELSRAR